MENKFLKILFLIITIVISTHGQRKLTDSDQEYKLKITPSGITNPDSLSRLIVLLSDLISNSDNEFFKQHCNSIIKVIEAETELSTAELSFLNNLYTTFSDTNVVWNASNLPSYLNRKRPFIIAWTSPTDGVVSLAWLLPPENWNPEQTYPLYLRLHGLHTPYQNLIEYMTYYLIPGTNMNTTFEDGYSLFPWGRGNLWFQGIGETDVWESIDYLEGLVNIDSSKKYLTGFSMGGYGAWYIGQKSPDTWAALGIYAGALWYGGNMLDTTVAQRLKDVPVYFVCGDQDDLLNSNQIAYQLLQDAGNPNITFATFSGGHESLLENWQNMYGWIKNFTNVNQVPDETFNTPQFQLYNNYPNPFNPSTNIRFEISEIGFVNLKVFDVLGREVATLVNEEKSPAVYEIEFNGSNLSSGVYFYRMQSSNFSNTKKFILMK